MGYFFLAYATVAEVIATSAPADTGDAGRISARGLRRSRPGYTAAFAMFLPVAHQAEFPRIAYGSGLASCLSVVVISWPFFKESPHARADRRNGALVDRRRHDARTRWESTDVVTIMPRERPAASRCRMR
jgi:hypothetical protein